MPPRIEPLASRLARLTAANGACLVWVGPRDRNGYGVVNVGQRKFKAHRVAWGLENGPIPDGLNALHRCDNPPCVRTAHLFLGTQSDNRADCVAKGRSRGGRLGVRGERNGASKLTDAQRIEITKHRIGLIQRGIGRQLLAALENAA